MRKHNSESSSAELAEPTAERARIETLQSRATLLPAEDRALLAMYLEARISFGQIARLVGTSKSTVARRIRRIVRRLTDDTYVLCSHCRHLFDEQEMGILWDYFIAGLSMQQIGRNRRLNHYRVRATINRARTLAHFTESSEAGERGESCV